MSGTRLVIIILSTLLLASAPLFATATCASGGGSNTLYPLLGGSYEYCGTVSYASPIVATVPEGALGPALEGWLGFDLDSVNGAVVDGSAILFPDFNISAQSNIGVDWTVEPEPYAEGYLFAAIDQSIVWSQVYSAGNESVLISGNQSIGIGTGNHSLALGIVRNCRNCTIWSDELPDPPFTFQLTGPTTVGSLIPEPSTVALIATGLGFLVLFRRRRKA